MINNNIKTYDEVNGFLFEIGNIIGVMYKLEEFYFYYNKENSEGIRKIYQANQIYLKKMKQQLEKDEILYIDSLINKPEEELKNLSLIEKFYHIYMNKLFIETLEITNYNIDLLKVNLIYIYINGFLNGYDFAKNLLNNSKQDETFNFLIQSLYFDISGMYKMFNKDKNIPKNINKLKTIFNNLTEDEIEKNQYQRGHFINSDFILHFVNQNKKKNIISIVDFSLHNNLLNIFDIDNDKIELLKNNYNDIMNKEISKIINKNLMETLNIDTTNLNKQLTEGIFQNSNEIVPLLHLDKENSKLVQSMAYGYTYLKYLKEYGKDNDSIEFKLFGLSNNDINSFHINEQYFHKKENIINNYDYIIDFLEKPYNIYLDMKNKRLENKSDVEEYIEKIITKLDFYQLFSIETNKDKIENFDEKTKKLHINNNYNLKELINFIEEPSKNIRNFKINEILPIENITNNNLRFLHAKNFIKLLKENDILYAIASPGIGKTTSTIGYLSQLDDFYCMYITSRVAVNEDFLLKPEEDLKNIFKPEVLESYGLNHYDYENFVKTFVSFTTNSKMLENNGIKISSEETAEKLNIKMKEFNLSKFYFVNDEDLKSNNSDSKSGNNTINDNKTVLKNIKNKEKVFDNISKTSIEIMKYCKDKNKIISTFALQGYNKNNFLTLFNYLKYLKSNNINNLIIMLDEMTGAESSINFAKDLFDLFYRYEDETKIHIKRNEIEINNELINIENINLKIIFSDASFSNNEVAEDYFETDFENPKLFIDVIKINKNIDNNIDNKEKIEIYKLSEKSRFYIDKHAIINVNSFPAKNIKLTFDITQIYTEKNDIKDDKIIRNKTIEELKNIFFNKIKEWFMDKNNLENNYQLFIYFQNKDVLTYLYDELKNDNELNRIFKEFTNNELSDKILLINNKTLKNPKEKEKLKYKNNYNIIFATSTVSRGLSFKRINKELIYVPNFDMENQYNDIMQVMYRCRGDDELDSTLTKEIEFIIYNEIPYIDKNNIEEINFEKYKLFNYFNLFNSIFLLKTIILTRIDGYYKFNKRRLRIIPNSKKGISDNNNQTTKIIKLISNIYELNNEDDTDENIKEFIQKFLSMTNQNYVLETNNIDLLPEKINTLLKAKNLRQLIEMNIKDDEGNSYFEKIDFNSNFIFINESFTNNLFNIITSKHEFKVFENLIKNIKEKYKKNYNISILINEIEIDFKVLYQFEQHTIEDNSNIKGKFSIPLYTLLLTKYLKSINFDIQNTEFTNLQKFIISRKYFVDKKKILPFSNNNHFNQEIPFIIFFESAFEDIINKKYNKKYLTSIPLLNSLNIINMKYTKK